MPPCVVKIGSIWPKVYRKHRGHIDSETKEFVVSDPILLNNALSSDEYKGLKNLNVKDLNIGTNTYKGVKADEIKDKPASNSGVTSDPDPASYDEQ